MASVLCVVSKKVFETDARERGKLLGVGDLWATELYKSTHASLRPLGDGGDLFLVTVRPPDEALWLVAVLRAPKLETDGWRSAPNSARIVDVSGLKGQIRFATGAGITAAKGKLGMSLQTPRTLTPADAALLLAAAGAPPPAGRAFHLNRHESGLLPCLCKNCIGSTDERFVVGGEAFVRREARAKDRVLYHWLPEILLGVEGRVRRDIENRMRLRLKDVVLHDAGGSGSQGGSRGRGDDEEGEEDDE